MTEAVFKVQAKRLAEHLSRVHGVKLKHASVLEAIAGLHGRADWNTLVACGAAGVDTARSAPPAVAAVIGPARSVAEAPTDFSLDGWIRHAMSEGRNEFSLVSTVTGYAAYARQDGVPVQWHQGSTEDFQRLEAELGRRAGFAEGNTGPQYGSFVFGSDASRFTVRVSTTPSANSGQYFVFRWARLDSPLHQLSSLGITSLAAWVRGITHAGGLCLVAGVTGSGRTTTLAASTRELVQRGRSVLVLDDELELGSIPGATHGDAPLEGFDVILLGQIRDAASMRLAFEAASRGQLVLASIHAVSANGAMLRLKDIGAAEEDINDLVKAVLAQKLVRRTCTHCQGAGCVQCHQGYDARTAVSECIAVDSSRKIAAELGRDRDGLTLVDDAIAKCIEGVTTELELERLFGTEVRERLALITAQR